MRKLATHRRRARFVMLTGLLILVGSHAHAQPGGVDPLWDHYRVYTASEGPLTAPAVILEDQFGSWSYPNPVLAFFANPDQKTHDGVVHPINDPRLHYTWWFLGQDTFARPGIQVENQFGPQVIDVGGIQQYLLNPATKNDAGPIPIANHYKCYDCFGTAPNVTVSLTDQFTTRTAVVGRPAWLCNPTRKTVVGGPTYDIVNPDQHLVCYDLGPQPGTFSAVVSDQFIQNWALDVSDNMFLCVPSLKFDPTPTRPSTWGRLKTLYR